MGNGGDQGDDGSGCVGPAFAKATADKLGSWNG